MHKWLYKNQLLSNSIRLVLTSCKIQFEYSWLRYAHTFIRKSEERQEQNKIDRIWRKFVCINWLVNSSKFIFFYLHLFLLHSSARLHSHTIGTFYRLFRNFHKRFPFGSKIYWPNFKQKKRWYRRKDENYRNIKGGGVIVEWKCGNAEMRIVFLCLRWHLFTYFEIEPCFHS